jgi:hypothetical protein
MSIVMKDFYKADVTRFDIEMLSGNMVKFDVSNVISWDIMRLKMTKDELRGLGNFIKSFVENSNETN